MAEYIEREAAIKDICNRLSNEHGVYSVVKNLINHVPAADVSPVRHGMWVLKTFDDGYGEYQLYECDQCGAHTAQKCRNFCHNCGAKMDGEA